MNSTFLYAATIAVSLISTVAMADEAPLTRAQVNAETRQAIANGTLQRTDYDTGSYRPQAVTSNLTREQVAIELAQAKTARKALIGPDANRTYNPFGTQILETSTLARSEVKDEVRQAQAAGTLQRTDYDDVASLTRKTKQHTASTNFSQRFKAKFAKNQS
ncbi:MAG: DUF4148 domain-containing protein [Pseudomonadota bacterium]